MPGLVQFEVYDTGIGIPAEHLTAIFEKFYEVGDALQHSSGQYEFKSGGLGIGLATAKDILARHGTALEVESEVDRGSVFRFCLEVVED